MSIIIGRSVITDRMLQIIDMRSDGLQITEIGALLFVTKDTVKTHLTRLYRLLEVHSSAQAAVRVAQLRADGRLPARSVVSDLAPLAAQVQYVAAPRARGAVGSPGQPVGPRRYKPVESALADSVVVRLGRRAFAHEQACGWVSNPAVDCPVVILLWSVATSVLRVRAALMVEDVLAAYAENE